MRHHNVTKRGRTATAVLGALGAAAVIAVPLFLTHHHPAPPHAAPPSASPRPSAAPSPPPAPLYLVQGTVQTDGVESGYPHTTAGAVSAAAEYLGAIASTLDPDYAASVARAVGDPAQTSLPSDTASGTEQLRATLRVPTSGPLPFTVTFLTTPQMYQLRDVTADHVEVLLLTSNTYIDAAGASASTTGVFPVQMHWVDGDWRLAEIGDDTQDFSGLDAVPDTARAASLGWARLLGGDS